MESVSRCNEAGEGHLLGWDWRLLGSAGHPGEGITLCLAPERQEVQGRERSREERGATLGGGVDLELPVAPLGGFPGGSVVKNPPASAGELGSLPGSGRSLEEETATHSSVLAWRSPWTEEPGGLRSMGSQRVGQDLATKRTNKSSCGSRRLSLKFVFLLTLSSGLARETDRRARACPVLACRPPAPTTPNCSLSHPQAKPSEKAQLPRPQFTLSRVFPLFFSLPNPYTASNVQLKSHLLHEGFRWEHPQV